MLVFRLKRIFHYLEIALAFYNAGAVVRKFRIRRIGCWWEFFKQIFAPTESLRLREKFAPTGKVCAYRKNLRLATVGT
jgi:hypothetical protein